MMSLSPMTRTEHTAEKSAFTCAGAFTVKGVYSGLTINWVQALIGMLSDLFPGILQGLCVVHLAVAPTGKTATSQAVWEM